MKNLSIKVSSIANVVTNGDFELWQNNVPLGWSAVVGDGSTGYANTLWGLGVQIVLPAETVSTVPSVAQSISASMLSADSYTIGYWSKGDITITISGGATLSESHYDADWTFHESTFDCDGSTTVLTLTKASYNGELYSACYFDNVYIYNNSWYENRLPLNVNQIKDFENFTREIEDDLFTFKSDALSFTIRNYGSDGSYFNTNDFETYSDRIFRFDILATYDGADGSDIVKKMVLFSNNDTIHKTRQPKSNDLEIQLYELSSLFKDNGWFLGTAVTDEESEETYFKYNTYSGNDPSIVANSISIDEAIANLQSDIRGLIRRHFIPVPLSDFEISKTLTAGTDLININYDWLIDTGSGKYIVLDMVSSPTGRTFFMLLPYDMIDETIGDNAITIWEMMNGSTLTQLVTPAMGWYASFTGVLGDDCSIGFIHEIMSDTYSQHGSPIMFGVVQNLNSGNFDLYRYKLYTDNSGTSLQGGSYNDNTEDDIKLYFKLDWVALTSPYYLDLNKCRAIDSNGSTWIPETYNPNRDNMIWFDYGSGTTISGNEGTFTVSNLETEGTDITFKLTYASTLNASIYRFPQYYSFIFKDAYPSDVLKDICVSQDAFWYIDYSQTNNDITVTLINRTASTDDPPIINDNIAIREDSFVRRIKFKDLDGTIFRDDATRLNYYLAYYNSTYGGGKFEKEFEMRGYRDYSIGDLITYENNNYFIKRFELFTNNRKTLVTLFQKAE